MSRNEIVTMSDIMGIVSLLILSVLLLLFFYHFISGKIKNRKLHEILWNVLFSIVSLFLFLSLLKVNKIFTFVVGMQKQDFGKWLLQNNKKAVSLIMLVIAFYCYCCLFQEVLRYGYKIISKKIVERKENKNMTRKRIAGFEQFTEDYAAAVDQAYYLSEDELADMVDVLFDSSNDIEDSRSINIEAEMTVDNNPLIFNFTLLLDDDRQPYIEYRGYI